MLGTLSTTNAARFHWCEIVPSLAGSGVRDVDREDWDMPFVAVSCSPAKALPQ
jgi:hypothetical protein